MCVFVYFLNVGNSLFLNRSDRVLPNLCDYSPILGFYSFTVINNFYQELPLFSLPSERAPEAGLQHERD